jgi:hypothetical protein
VAHACHPWEAEIGSTAVPGQLGQKVPETPSQPIARCGSIHLPVRLQQCVENRLAVQADLSTN